jgi:hypothetical protein
MSIATMTVIGFRKKRPARSRRLARIGGKSRPESVAAPRKQGQAAYPHRRDRYINHPSSNCRGIGSRLRRLERIETRQIPKPRQELPHRHRPLDVSPGETTDRIFGTGKPCLAHCVDPRGTSRTCPACGKDDRRNRMGETFRCIAAITKAMPISSALETS